MEANRFDEIYWPLRITYGAIPLLAGLDKFVGLLADWEAYLHPALARLLPVAPETFMGIVGVVEIAVGLAVLTRATRLGAWLAAGWLVAIALQLAAAGILDVAVRDLAMAVGAYSLARLAEARGEALWPHRSASGAA